MDDLSGTTKHVLVAVARACLPHMIPNTQFFYSVRYLIDGFEFRNQTTRDGNARISTDSGLHFYISSFTLDGVTDTTEATWRSCRVTIKVNDSKQYEFFCTRSEDGPIRVRTMAVMRQSRSMKWAVKGTLDRLGTTAGAIGRQLDAAGFTRDCQGLTQFLGAVFALENVEIFAVNPEKVELYEIRGRRIGNPDLELSLRTSRKPICAFLSQEIRPTL